MEPGWKGAAGELGGPGALGKPPPQCGQAAEERQTEGGAPSGLLCHVWLLWERLCTPGLGLED